MDLQEQEEAPCLAWKLPQVSRALAEWWLRRQGALLRANSISKMGTKKMLMSFMETLIQSWSILGSQTCRLSCSLEKRLRSCARLSFKSQSNWSSKRCTILICCCLRRSMPDCCGPSQQGLIKRTAKELRVYEETLAYWYEKWLTKCLKSFCMRRTLKKRWTIARERYLIFRTTESTFLSWLSPSPCHETLMMRRMDTRPSSHMWCLPRDLRTQSMWNLRLVTEFPLSLCVRRARCRVSDLRTHKMLLTRDYLWTMSITWPSK